MSDVTCLRCEHPALECECEEPCCEACGCSIGIGGIEGMCVDCCEADEEPEPIDDGVRFCPGCERPNQFGERCASCEAEDVEEQSLDEARPVWDEENPNLHVHWCPCTSCAQFREQML
jgi:hypothetical protein